MSFSCKDCPDRTVGCHSVCPKYLEEKRIREEELEERRIQGSHKWDYKSYHQDRVDKSLKRRRSD